MTTILPNRLTLPMACVTHTFYTPYHDAMREGCTRLEESNAGDIVALTIDYTQHGYQSHFGPVRNVVERTEQVEGYREGMVFQQTSFSKLDWGRQHAVAHPCMSLQCDECVDVDGICDLLEKHVVGSDPEPKEFLFTALPDAALMMGTSTWATLMTTQGFSERQEIVNREMLFMLPYALESAHEIIERQAEFKRVLDFVNAIWGLPSGKFDGNWTHFQLPDLSDLAATGYSCTPQP